MSFFPKSEDSHSPRSLLEHDVRQVIQKLEIGDCINLVLNDDMQGRFIMLSMSDQELMVEFTNAQRYQSIAISDITYLEKAPNPAFPVSGQKLGAAYHITMYGVCDQAHHNDLLIQIETAIKSEVKNVIIRCNNLTGISSTGIAMLIVAYSKLKKHDISMCLVNTEEHIKKILHNTSVDTIFNIF